jgi:hypothetical protein
MTKTIILAAAALLMASAPAYAINCYERTIVTPDNAPVNRASYTLGNPGGNNGTAYTKAAFCPKAAAADTCTGESLSELNRGGAMTKYVTLDGVVADIEEFRKGIQLGPIFIGTPWTAGSCP